MKTNKLLLILFTLVFFTSALFAQKTLTESFDYTAGSLSGVGTATNGWAGPWTEGLTPSNGGLLSAIEGNFGNDFGRTAKLQQSPDYTGSNTVVRFTRDLSTDYCFVDNVAGQEIWISFYFKNTINSALSTGSQSYLQLSDPLNSFSCPPIGTLSINTDVPGTLGMNQGATSIAGSSETDLTYILVKLVLDGAGASNGDKAYMWLNYTGSTAPDISTAQATRTFTVGSASKAANISRLNLLTYKNRVAYFDKIRISNTFAQDITTGINDVVANNKIHKSGINELSLDLNGMSNNCELQILDMAGRQLLRQQLLNKGNEIVKVKLQTGLYIVKVTDNQSTIATKIKF
jgi:hypothetical protein